MTEIDFFQQMQAENEEFRSKTFKGRTAPEMVRLLDAHETETLSFRGVAGTGFVLNESKKTWSWAVSILAEGHLSYRQERQLRRIYGRDQKVVFEIKGQMRAYVRH